MIRLYVRAAEWDPIILFSSNKQLISICSDILNIFKALRSGDVLCLGPMPIIHFSKRACILSNSSLLPLERDSKSQP